MSIATDITGGSGGSASQLLDLLANPDAYKAKLQAMEAATAEYKKYVEAVGVATEVVSLREEAKALRDEAKNYRDNAVAEADKGLKDAQAKADALLDSAKQQADDLAADAKANKAQADSLLTQATSAMRAAQIAQDRKSTRLNSSH